MPDVERPAEDPRPTQTPLPASGGTQPRHDRAGRVMIAIAIVALAVFLGVSAYRRASAQTDARGQVKRAGELIERVDGTIRQVDELVRAQATAEIAEETAALLERLPEAKRETSEAAKLLAGATPRLARGEQQDAVEAAEAALLRYELLDASVPLLEATEKASLAVGPAEEGWELLLAAEERSDKAAALYNTHDKKKARESREIGKSAAEDVRKAQALFGGAHAAMPEAGLKAYADYCAERLEVLALADKADAAFLGGDIAKANDLSDKYNAREKDLAALAKKLPKSPSQAINDAYTRLTEAAEPRYSAARERVMTL